MQGCPAAVPRAWTSFTAESRLVFPREQLVLVFDACWRDTDETDLRTCCIDSRIRCACGPHRGSGVAAAPAVATATTAAAATLPAARAPDPAGGRRRRVRAERLRAAHAQL